MDNAKVIERIIKGLTQKPAYLLAFGVFFLLLGGGLAAALVNSTIASNALILAGIAFVALIAVIFIVEREGRGVRETVRYEIPDGLNINFAVIDEGEIIASTDPSGGEQFTGTFYFKEAGFRETYRGVVEELTRGSIPFEEFAQHQGLQQDPVAL